jgi:hypothetical protein
MEAKEPHISDVKNLWRKADQMVAMVAEVAILYLKVTSNYGPYFTLSIENMY